MGTKGFPQQQLDEIEPSEVQRIVTSLKELHQMGRPETDEEYEQRIDEYFAFCERSAIRPGIESLCLALHITRTSLYNYCNGLQCSERKKQASLSAKSFIAAYIEQASMSGKINPASGIFLMKNWLGYKDSVSFEATTQQETISVIPMTDAEISKEIGGLLNVTDLSIAESEVKEDE